MLTALEWCLKEWCAITHVLHIYTCVIHVYLCVHCLYRNKFVFNAGPAQNCILLLRTCDVHKLNPIQSKYGDNLSSLSGLLGGSTESHDQSACRDGSARIERSKIKLY